MADNYPIAFSGLLSRFLLAVMISIALIFVDTRTDYLSRLRSTLGIVVTPVHYLAAVPARVGNRFDEWLETEESIRATYEELLVEHVRLKQSLSDLRALELENQELRRALQASERSRGEVLVAELVEVSLDPFVQKVLINKGAVDGVYVGQPVFDPGGVIGQVDEVLTINSTVTLITDASHGLPVQVERSLLRAVAQGTGLSNALDIAYLSPNVDIRVDDVLVTSGLGGRFPPGYPVARVTEVINDSAEPFLTVTAEPLSELGHGRYVMLPSPRSSSPEAPGRR